jgi:hypothetical protein
MILLKRRVGLVEMNIILSEPSIIVSVNRLSHRVINPPRPLCRN